MVRPVLRRLAGVLAVSLSACLGGQTGQPDGASAHGCFPTELAPTAIWSGTTVQSAVSAFEGTYQAGLSWQKETRRDATHTAVGFADAAQLSITFGGGAVGRDCDNELSVPVTVAFTTTNSGIVDNGQGNLTITRSSQGLVGSLRYESMSVKLDATLTAVALAQAPNGSFDALDSTAPGASAVFNEVP